MATELPTARPDTAERPGRLLDARKRRLLIGLAALLCLGTYFDAAQFLTLDTMSRILRAAAPVTFIGYGVALLMTAGEFDLSVGSMYGLAAAMAAVMISHTLGPSINVPFTVFMILGFAFVLGVSQGLLVTKLGLPSLIVTIGTLTVFRGFQRIFLTGTNLLWDERGLTWLGGEVPLGSMPFLPAEYELEYALPFIHDSTQTWSGFSIQIVWMLLFLWLFHYLLFYTRFGHHVRATGDNVESVGTTSIDPEMVKLAAFGIAALMAAFAGLANLGRVGSVTPSTGSGLELTVIPAVVLGGTKLTGGRGSMLGVLLGALVLSTANTVLFLAGLGVSGWQGIITGGFLIAAIVLDRLARRHGGSLPTLLRREYVAPLGPLLATPGEFFRTDAARKTSDAMVGFLLGSIAVAALLTNLLAWVLGRDTAASALGIDARSEFMLVLEGGWPVTVAQLYLFVAAVTLLAVAAITATTRALGTRGDFEDTLATVCYGMAAAPLLAIGTVVVGFDLWVLGGVLVTVLLVVLPVFLLFTRTMHAGVRERHHLSRGWAGVVVAAVWVAWLAVAGFVAWGLG